MEYRRRPKQHAIAVVVEHRAIHVYAIYRGKKNIIMLTSLVLSLFLVIMHVIVKVHLSDIHCQFDLIYYSFKIVQL